MSHLPSPHRYNMTHSLTPPSSFKKVNIKDHSLPFRDASFHPLSHITQILITNREAIVLIVSSIFIHFGSHILITIY